MRKVYLKERAELLKNNDTSQQVVFTGESIKHLPVPIQKHLRVSGFLNRPVPVNANVIWKESYFKMAPDRDWAKIQTLQFNSVKPIARVAYMKFSSMPISARDIYRDGYGEMKVKLFNLFKIAFENNKETAQSALITSFAEFLIIPGYFLLDNVKWETINESTVRAELNDNGIEVSGRFLFNSDGRIYRFETDDRYYSFSKNDYRKVKYSAVIDSYQKHGDVSIPENVKVVWHLPEDDFEYYKGAIASIEYNVQE